MFAATCPLMLWRRQLAEAYANPASVVGSIAARVKPQQQNRKSGLALQDPLRMACALLTRLPARPLAIDQTLVAWDEDAAALNCPLCG